MKQYFFIPILLIGIALSAQRYDPYNKDPEWNTYKRLCPTFITSSWNGSSDKCTWLADYSNKAFDRRPNDLKYFADFFFFSLNGFYAEKYPGYGRKKGWDFTIIDDSFNVEGNAAKIKFTFQSFSDGRIAFAKSPGDRNYEIVIDPQKWDQAHVAEKVWIMWHELAHEFFSTKHGQAGGMMFPISPGEDITLQRLWNGWESMATWLVENKRNEILRLYIPWYDSPSGKKMKKQNDSFNN
jgi:hypothetical protein